MTKTRTGALILAATAIFGLALPATAQDAVVADAETPASPFSVSIDNYFTVDNAGYATSNHEVDWTFEGTNGDWTFGLDLWGGVNLDYDASTGTLDTPTVLLYGSSDAFGEIDLWDASDALGNACITPTNGSSHFGTEDLLTFGTCGGYSGKAILYTSPILANGLGVQVSAVGDPMGTADDASVDSSLSAALTYTSTTEGGLDINASLGVDVATSVKGGLPDGVALPATVQAGLQLGWDGWTLGAAGQYEFASLSGGDSWGAGLGLGKVVTDKLTFTAELSGDGYEESGVKFTELSLSGTAEYQVFDNTSIDAGIDFLRRTGDDGSEENASQVGMGMNVSF